MKKLYYVGVYLNQRVHFGLYGFTSYVDCYTEAETPQEAGQIAKHYYETKYKIKVTDTRPQPAKPKFVPQDQLIKPLPVLEQPKLF